MVSGVPPAMWPLGGYRDLSDGGWTPPLKCERPSAAASKEATPPPLGRGPRLACRPRPWVRDKQILLPVIDTPWDAALHKKTRVQDALLVLAGDHCLSPDVACNIYRTLP